jgi:deazaflavin-dependent oxidoreductase (nitroreductase family)
VAKEFRFGFARKIGNALISPAAKLGVAGSKVYILTVPGRRSGILRSNPVQLVVDGNDRWLVAPYGIVDWVKNARAAGRVTLTRAGRSEEVSVSEVGAAEAGPILKRYVKQVGRVVYPYFDVGPDASTEEFAGEARRHPVFRVASL